MSEQALVVPEIEPLAQQHAPLMERCRSITTIPSALVYESAAFCKKELAGRRLFLIDFFAPMKKAAKRTHEVICEREHLVSDPIIAEETRLGTLLVSYDDEQERQRQLAEKRAQEEAQLAEAQHYEAMGDAPAMEATLDGQGLVQVRVPSSVPKVAGISYRETWAAEVTDLLALVKAVAIGKAPLAYLQANTVALHAAARSLKTELNQIAGVRAVVTKTAIGRR